MEFKKERFGFKIEREKGRKDESNFLFYQARGVFVLKKRDFEKRRKFRGGECAENAANATKSNLLLYHKPGEKNKKKRYASQFFSFARLLKERGR